MTKRREVVFESDIALADRPTRGKLAEKQPVNFLVLAEIEVLCGRAARLSYLTEYEVGQLIAEIKFVKKSGPVFSRESIPVNLSPSIRSGEVTFSPFFIVREFLRSVTVNLHNIVTPLLHFIQGSIVILENQVSGCQVHVFRAFEEIWICFR